MATEADVWRTALEARGRDWVLTQLRTRYGQPQDPMLDVVYEPPHPSREFCQRWCVEVDNRFLHLSTSTKAALIALLVLAVFTSMAVHSWTRTQAKSASSHSDRQ